MTIDETIDGLEGMIGWMCDPYVVDVEACETAIKVLKQFKGLQEIRKEIEDDWQHTFDGCINKKYVYELIDKRINELNE